MSYNVIADKIEIRSSEDKSNPRYIVNAIGAIANKKHIYEYSKKADGTFKTLKSMFTPHCIESIKNQSQNKKIFIDTQHEFVRDASIKAMAKGKFSKDEEKQLDNMLKRKKLPLAKLNDIDIEDNELKIYTELNPMFREVDLDHQKYFDAVWYSLENKFLNGVSINFGEFKYDTDVNGDTVIDDVDVLGFSYLDAPAEHANSIYEVAIRGIEESVNIREGVMMEDEKKQFEADKAKLEEDRKKFEDDKVTATKATEDATKAAELKKQEDEHKKLQDDLDAKTEELKKAEEDRIKLQAEANSSKGVVGQTNPQNTNNGKSYDGTFYEGNIKDIISEHDKTIELKSKGIKPMVDNTMKGFGELASLQAKNGPTAGLDRDDADDIGKGRLLERGKADIITPAIKGVQ